MKEINPTDSILIDKFILGTITALEQEEFDKRASDDEFIKELEFRKSVLQVSEQKGDEIFHQLLQEESRRMDLTKSGRRSRLYWYIFALLILAGLYFFVRPSEKERSNDEIFIAYYEPFPNLIAPIERSTAGKLEGLPLAMYAYENGDYSRAVQVFDTLSLVNLDAKIYHAISSMEVGADDQAKKIFIDISSDSTSRFHDAADWFLSLLYLKQGDMTEFSASTDYILSNKNHKYFKKAVELRGSIGFEK